MLNKNAQSFFNISKIIILLLVTVQLHIGVRSASADEFGCDCAAATYVNTVPPNAGGQRNIQSGELLCITETTTFTENLARVEGNVCVDPSATYQVNQNFQYYSGEITNYGMMEFTTSTNMSATAVLTNYGQLTGSTNASFNINDSATIVNKEDASLTFNAGITLGGTSTIQNEGVFTLTSHVNIHSSASIINSGLVIAKNNVALTGDITNTGEFYMLGTLNLNNGASLNNDCRMVSTEGFVNGGAIVNNGMIYEVPTNTPLADGNTWTSSDTFQNNGTWINGQDGIVYGVDFSSSGTISGGGTFYFEDFTRLNGGSFGVDTDTDEINFYDANLACSGTGSGPNGEFDDAPSWMAIEELTCAAIAVPSFSHFPATCSAGALNLKVTVGETSGECSLADAVLLDEPDDAFYCYTIENLSGVDVTVNALVDDKIDLSGYDLGLPVTLSAIDETSLQIDSYSILLTAINVEEDLLNSAIATGFDELGSPVSAGDSAFVDMLISAPTSVSLSDSGVGSRLQFSFAGIGFFFLMTVCASMYIMYRRPKA